jgi:hypothetical protein
MKHLLIDFDSTIPNLALMKISAWAKAKGDQVFLNNMEDEPDFIWLSAIFTWNRKNAEIALGSLKFQFPKAVIRFGGTCFDWGMIKDRIQLPIEIENTLPDYSLYNDDRAVGFCQRGCNRKCQFCDVWRKEGRIEDNAYHRLTEWVPDDFKKVLLLDNDIALAEDWKHDQVLTDARDMGLKLSITQGYDIRCITEDRAKLLAEHKPYNKDFKAYNLYFSWDYIQNEKWVRKGIEILKDAGFTGRQLTCYVLIGFNTTHEQDMHRIDVLWKEYGVYPYIMAYQNDKKDPMISAVVRWVNKRQLFKSMPFSEYKRNPEYKARKKHLNMTRQLEGFW